MSHMSRSASPRVRNTLIIGLAAAMLLSTGGSADGRTLQQPPDDAWETLAPVPARGTGVEGASVAAVNTGQIIAAYGYDGRDTRRTRIYDVSTDTWTLGSRAPRPARSEATAVSRNNLMYAIGGRATRVRADTERYDAVDDQWTSLADMPTARAGLASAIVQEHIYAIGGRTLGGGPCSGGELAVVERYDIRTDTWVTVAPLPTPRSDAAATAVGDRVFVFGGCRTNPTTGRTRVLRSVDVYDTTTDVWSREPANLPRPRTAFYQVAALGEHGANPKVYVIGGWSGRGIGAASVFIYDVSADTYSRGSRMPTHRAEMGVATLRQRIYAVGGAQPAFGASVDALEVYRP